LDEVIRELNEELECLMDRTSREITEMKSYLKRNRARIKVFPRIKKSSGYNTFSIIWKRFYYYDWKTGRHKTRDIRKGRGHMVPRGRLLLYLKDSEAWEIDYILKKEQEFARTRKKVALLSKTIMILKKYSRKHKSSINREGNQDHVVTEGIH